MGESRLSLKIGPLTLTINLQACQASGENFLAHFEIEPFRRTCLLEGLDDIGMTLRYEGEIAEFEEKQRRALQA